MRPFILHILFHFFLGSSALGQEITINEIQNRNINTIADEDEDYEDWVEFYNGSSSELDLTGYGLTDNQSMPFKWVFPEVTIPPDGFLLVWLSGKDRTDSAAPLHANFSLSADEPLILSDPSSDDFALAPPVFLTIDASYGLEIDTQEWVYFEQPTPEIPNFTQSFQGISSPPVFSHESGFYESAFALNITSNTEEQIYYTTDGSHPVGGNDTTQTDFSYKNNFPGLPDDPFGEFLSDTMYSIVYADPIMIEDRSEQEDKLSQKSSTIDFNPAYIPEDPSFKGTAIRAVAVEPGFLPSEVVTSVFFITPQGWNRYNLPVASVVIPENSLFDYAEGIHTAGIAFDSWRNQNPNDDSPPVSKANYGQRGRITEKLAWFEFFNPTSQTVPIATNVGLRIHGGASRRFARKSLRLYARDEYGNDQIDYPIFENHQIEIFERLVLRNSGGDERYANMRDVVITEIAEPMNALVSASQPCFVFINAEFYGLNNVRESIDNNYFKIRFGIENENLDLVEGSNLTEGDDTRLNEVMALCQNGDFTTASTIEEFENFVEVESFFDTFITNFFGANTDMFPKNTIWWRDREPSDGDDRFKSFFYDTDRSWAHPISADSINTTANPYVFYLEENIDFTHPYLNCFQAAMTNPNLETYFINRSADVMNTFFLPERTTSIITEFVDLYSPFIEEQIDRWSGNSNVQNMAEWEEYIAEMIAFSEYRPGFFRQHIVDYFETGGDYDLVLDVSDESHGFIHLNTIDILSATEGISENVYPWEGVYFKNVPVTFTAVPYEGFLFSHWEGAFDSNDVSFISAFDSDSIYAKAVFVPDPALSSTAEDVGQSLLVYPNPTHDGFQFKTVPNTIKTLIVFDLTGRVVFEESAPIPESQLFHLPDQAGVYFLQVNYSDGISARTKLIKQ